MVTEDEIRKDREKGLTYRQLCKKYHKSPRDLAQILKGSEIERPYLIEPRFSISEKSKIIIFNLALKWNLSPDKVIEKLFKEWIELSETLTHQSKITVHLDPRDARLIQTLVKRFEKEGVPISAGGVIRRILKPILQKIRKKLRRMGELG